MVSKKMTRAKAIRWLGAAISTETEKPFEEVNYDFVEKCGYLLDELMDKSTAMSEEEIAKKLEKLKPDTTSAVRKRIGHRKLGKIAIAATVVLCMSVTVVAIPELRVRLLNALQLCVGESIVKDRVTYINGGKTSKYDNIDALIATENLDILSFDDPQDQIRLMSIKHLDSVSLTILIFEDPDIYFEILHDQNMITDAIIQSSQKHYFPNIETDVYILVKDDDGTLTYNAYIYYENDTYMIRNSSEFVLHTILASLRKGD